MVPMCPSQAPSQAAGLALPKRLAMAVLKLIYAWPYKPPMTVEELSFRLREDIGGPHHLRW